jgi:hypothetical protein
LKSSLEASMRRLQSMKVRGMRHRSTSTLRSGPAATKRFAVASASSGAPASVLT